MDLETFLVTLVGGRLVGREPSSETSQARLSDAEVLTLAVLAQWPRWRSERDFSRFADAHLHGYFPDLVGRSQLNRRVRAPEAGLASFRRDPTSTLGRGAEVYRVIDTTLIRRS